MAAGGGKPVKVLVSGPPKGNFAPLLERLAKLNASKHGPFDACFVVGDFFEGGHAAVADFVEQVSEGELSVAVPIHFILGSDEAAPAVTALLPEGGGEAAPNVHFLGPAGVATVAGLRVAYLGGMRPAKRTADQLISTAGGGGVDVLLSCAWPTGFNRHVPPAQLPTLPAGSPILPAAGNAAVARVAAAVKPRYHFVGQYGVHYARPPYGNAPPTGLAGGEGGEAGVAGEGGEAYTTRLVALGNVNTEGNKATKYLHAVSLVPAASAGKEVLLAAPAGTTGNPYTHTAAPAAAAGGDAESRGLKRARTAAGSDTMTQAELARLEQQATAAARSQQQFFFSGNPGTRPKRPRGEGRGPPQPRECWFCMSSPSYEKHLVASIATSAYLALPKGGINGDHVLIVPVDHAPSLAAAPAPLLGDVASYKAALGAYFASKDQFLVAFERVAITRNPVHTHMQAIGLPRGNAAAAPALIASEGQRCSLPFTKLPEGVTFPQYIATAFPGGPPRQYLYVEAHVPPAAGAELVDVAPGEEEEAAPALPAAPVVHRFLYIVPEGATQPLQFGRDLMCVLLHLPHRKHWRDCKLSQEEETGMTGAFREAFEPFDFSADADSSDDE